MPASVASHRRRYQMVEPAEARLLAIGFLTAAANALTHASPSQDSFAREQIEFACLFVGSPVEGDVTLPDCGILRA